MPIKLLVRIMVIAGVIALGFYFLNEPFWSIVSLWGGGMVLLWIMTGRVVPQKPATTDEADNPAAEAAKPAEALDELRPIAGSMEDYDIEDLSRLDGTPPVDEKSRQ